MNRQGPGQPPGGGGPDHNNPNHKTVTGRVTKLVDNFGFIDDDVFFQTSHVRGGPVRVGDQVYAECSFNPRLPFQWTATSVQIMPAPPNPNVNSTYIPQNAPAMQRDQPPPQQGPGGYGRGDSDQRMGHYPPQQQTRDQMHRQPPPHGGYGAGDGGYQPPMRRGDDRMDGMRPGGPPPGQMGNQQPPSDPRAERYPPSEAERYYQQQKAYQGGKVDEPPYGAPFQQQPLTYTSQPGSAFVSPFQGPPSNSGPPPGSQAPMSRDQQMKQPPFGISGVPPPIRGGHVSRWEPRGPEEDARPPPMPVEPPMRQDPRLRGREDPRPSPAMPERDRSIERPQRQRDRDFGHEGRDRFGRDKDRNDNQERDRSRRSTESPASSTGPNKRQNRRRYEPINIPKYSLIKERISAIDIKNRYSPTIHIPSDFKEVRLNSKFRLNLKEIPKPIKYRIKTAPKKEEPTVNGSTEKKKSEKVDKDKDSNSTEKESKPEQPEQTATVPVKTENDSSSTTSSTSGSKSSKVKQPKIGVKVLLLSLPPMSEIFDRVLGSDHDLSSKANYLFFNKLLQFLCSKNSNDGHTLIGGKYNATLDGFYEGTSQPNLVATAIRCVKEQTGLDLTGCKRWKNFIRFAYNRDDSPTDSAELELSYVYIPDIWTIVDQQKAVKVTDASISSTVAHNNSQDDKGLVAKTETVAPSDAADTKVEDKPLADPDGSSSATEPQPPPGNPTLSEEGLPPSEPQSQSDADNSSLGVNSDAMDTSVPTDGSGEDTQALSDLLGRIPDLKVAELKAELQKRSVAVNPKWKKADLVRELTALVERDLQAGNTENGVDDVPPTSTTLAPSAESVDSTPDQTDNGPATTITTSSAVVESESQPMEVSEPTQLAIDQQVISENNGSESAAADDQKGMGEQKPVKAEQVESPAKGEKRAKSQSPPPAKSKRSRTESAGKKGDTSDESAIEVVSHVPLSVISLYQALSHQKYDHFELAVTVELLREALVLHFTNHILATLLHNKPLSAVAEKAERAETEEKRKFSPNYTQLAFSYFDATHCGYLLCDDMMRMLHNAGYTLSKKVWTSMRGNENHDKVVYKFLAEPTAFVDYAKFASELNEAEAGKGEAGSSSVTTVGRMFEKNGNVYDVHKLIEQSERDEKNIAELKEQLKATQTKLASQSTDLEELKARKKKMTSAIGKQNDEICTLKREKEAFRIKYEEIRKELDSSVTKLSEILKKHKEEPKEIQQPTPQE